ncbi:WxL domain-containing protein [Actinosynnema sp. NPDC023587]|uniref:WxL domain-containing protein n=1 Tax=Actinosynnema sp. NPDC023587 TaxID=3154695 RepID=UPI0033EE31D6
MNRKSFVALALAGASAGLVATALPANAVDTIVTFTTSGGALTITAAATATLTGGTTTPGGSVNGPLGTVTVNDSRGTASGWLASVYSTTGFTGTGSVAITNAGVTYTPGATTATTAPGTPVITAGTPGSPGATAQAPLTAYTYANTTAGGNTVSWNPTLAVAIPLTATANTLYTGTISHQVA